MQVTHDSRSAISRARFFLDQAAAAPADARVEFEAYLEAAIIFARAAMHRFQQHYKHHPKWKEWWDSLLGDSAVTFVRTQRDWILKDAPPKIHQKVFAASIRLTGDHAPAYSPTFAFEFYYFEDPGTPATLTVGRHIDAVARVLGEGENLFAQNQ